MKRKIIDDLAGNFVTFNDLYSEGPEIAKTLAGFDDLKALLESYSPEQIRQFESDLTTGLASGGSLGLTNLSLGEIDQMQSEFLGAIEEIIEEKNRALERLVEERQLEAASSPDSTKSSTPESPPVSFGSFAGAGAGGQVTSPMAADYDDDPDLMAAMAASMMDSPLSISEHGLAEEAAMARMMAESMHDSPASAIDMTSPLDSSLDFTPPAPLDSLAAKMEYLATNKLASEGNSEGFKASIASDLADVNSDDEYYSNRLIMQILTKRYLTEDNVIIGKEVEYQEGSGFAKPEDVAKLITQTQAMAPGQVLIQPMHRVNAEGRAPHWISTVITKDASGQVHLTAADSMFNTHSPDGSVNQHRALEVLARTLGISKTNVHNISSFQQGNGSDCGAWLIENTTQIADQMLRSGIKGLATVEMLKVKDTDRSFAIAMRHHHGIEYMALVSESISPASFDPRRPLSPSPTLPKDRAAAKPRGLA